MHQMETYLVGCNQASEVLVAVAQAHLALAWEGWPRRWSAARFNVNVMVYVSFRR